MADILRVETEIRWCDQCKGNFNTYWIEFSDWSWVLINPHEHFLPVGICPKTVWISIDVSTEDFPQEIKEIFELCKDINARDKQAKIIEIIDQIKQKARENGNGKPQ